MAETKRPVVLKEGEPELLQPGEALPGQEEAEETRKLFRLLLFRLVEQGFKIVDEELLTELQLFIKS